MEHLDLIVDRTGYGVAETNTLITNVTAGGFPRRRKDIFNATKIVDCQFELKRSKYAYFWQFYEAYKRTAPTAAFTVYLVTDITDPLSPRQLHLVQIIPGSVRLLSKNGIGYIVGLQFESFGLA